MKNRITNNHKKQEGITPDIKDSAEFKDLVKKGMLEFVIKSGIESALELIEEEITTLCGERYRNIVDRTVYRWGTTKTAMVMGGKKILVERSRVRSRDKKQELLLKTVEALQQDDLLTDRQVEQMLIGVSTRKCHRSLEAVPTENKSSSDSKSSVSRRFVIKTKKMLDKWLHIPIEEEYPVLMIDGTVFKNTTVIIVLGINRDGKKRVLGICNGSTENYEVCKDLLNELIERGLDSNLVRLVVLDGGKAIRKAVSNVIGERIKVQRCQIHKIRNVMGYLPESLQPSVTRAMNEAYRSNDYNTAKQILSNLSNKLRKDNIQAANSLDEGLEETLTLHKFQTTDSLKKTLSTTNLIENLNGSIKRHTHRIKRWKNPNMVLRWVYTGIAEAEKGFRRIRGYKQLEQLIMIIDNGITNLEKPLDKNKGAA